MHGCPLNDDELLNYISDASGTTTSHLHISQHCREQEQIFPASIYVSPTFHLPEKVDMQKRQSDHHRGKKRRTCRH
jgi:hypothetical protein